MLTESFVTAIMETSITGAGLILAVLALVAQLSQRINFTQIPKESIPKMKNLLLGATLSLVATFYFYILSAIMAYGWVTEPNNQTGYEIFLKFFFLAGNALFLVFGGFVATLVYLVMERELRPPNQ